MKKVEEQKNKKVKKIEGAKISKKSILDDVRFKDLKEKAEEDHRAEIERVKKVVKNNK